MSAGQRAGEEESGDMQNNKNKSFAVGNWLVEPEINQISIVTQNLYLRPQLMDLLVYLADLDGQVATLESIHDDIWPGKVVSSGTIYNCIAELRQALAKDAKNLNYIETIPKKGYRLAAPVVAMPGAAVTSRSGTSMVVLPLVNHSGDTAIDYLCEGMAGEILHRLSKISGLRVFSAFGLKDEELDPRVIGLRFTAETVLTGSLLASGDKLRLTFRLDRVASGETLWSERFDRATAEVFELQDSVARQLVGALLPALDIGEPDHAVLEESGTHSLDAFHAFLLGNHALSKTTEQSYDDAIRCFDRSIVIDPSFARAHYRLYLSYYMKRREFGADRGFLERARTAAENARLHGYQPAVPWIHIQRRLYRHRQPRARDLALEALDKIRQPDPQWGSFAYEQLTWVLPAAGFFKATLDFAQHMLDSPAHNFQDSDAEEEVPAYHAAAGQFDSAIRMLSSAIQKDPTRPIFRMNRSLYYSRLHQFEYAQGDIDKLGDSRYALQAQMFYYSWKAQPDRVLEYHGHLLAIDNIHPSNLLFSYSLIGDFDTAIEQYSEAVNSLSRAFIDFGPLRATCRAKLPQTVVRELEQHPGFKKLLENEGVDDAWRVELMERVNELTHITGIHINLDDDPS